MNRMTPPRNRVFCALDTADAEHAQRLAAALAGTVGGLKLGLEFFTANGPGGVAALRASGLPIFLDLKFHDIPNTVAGAVRAAAALGPRLLTVHAGGGGAMIAAARAAAEEGAAAAGHPRPRLLAVTVLTSLDAAALAATGVAGTLDAQVRRLARLARDAGADGAVCSPHEVAMLRDACGPDFLLVVPGVRPAWAAAQDQKRVMPPAVALAQGADLLVIGRPITGADDPAAAARRIQSELAGGA